LSVRSSQRGNKRGISSSEKKSPKEGREPHSQKTGHTQGDIFSRYRQEKPEARFLQKSVHIGSSERQTDHFDVEFQEKVMHCNRIRRGHWDKKGTGHACGNDNARTERSDQRWTPKGGHKTAPMGQGPRKFFSKRCSGMGTGEGRNLRGAQNKNQTAGESM